MRKVDDDIIYMAAESKLRFDCCKSVIKSKYVIICEDLCLCYLFICYVGLQSPCLCDIGLCDLGLCHLCIYNLGLYDLHMSM